MPFEWVPEKDSDSCFMFTEGKGDEPSLQVFQLETGWVWRCLVAHRVRVHGFRKTAQDAMSAAVEAAGRLGMSNYKAKDTMTEKQLRLMAKAFYEWQDGDAGFRELHKQHFEALLVEVRRLNAEVRRLKKPRAGASGSGG